MDLTRCRLSRWRGDTTRCRWCDASLTGRRSSWCSQECARAFAVNHVWNAAKTECLERAAYTCAECGGGLMLEVNHLRAPVGGRIRYGTGCWNHQDVLEALCDKCHGVVTVIERRARSKNPDRPLQLHLPISA